MRKYNLWKEKIEKIAEKAKSIQDFYKRIETCDDLRKEARKELQEIANRLAKHFRTTHPPIYISKKYKIRKAGLYFQKRRTGAITLFPIRAYKFYSNGEKPELWVLTWDRIVDVLRHEFAHHLSRKNPGHGEDFKQALRKIEKIKI